jgi:HlyD family secretion protein
MFRKYLLPLLAIAGILFGAYSIVSSARPTPAAQPVVPPSQSPYRSQIAGSGIVEANTENISVGTLVSGVVVDVPVKVNQDVKRGDVLFRLDDRDLQAQKRTQEAALLMAERQLAKLIASPRPEDVPPLEAKVAEAEALLADMKSQWTRAEELRDTKAISEEEMTHRRYLMAQAQASLEQAKANLAQLKAGTWSADIDIARANVQSARATVAATLTNIERLVVTAPITGRVLQVNVRVGEYAQAGSFGGPANTLMLMGNVDPLYVRVDVDENDAWRIVGHPDAEGVVRGNPTARAPLKFVRIEPYVIPKKSLTGDTNERVDTRVLQIICSLEGSSLPVYAGQQMDVFINAPTPATGASQPVASGKR